MTTYLSGPRDGGRHIAVRPLTYEEGAPSHVSAEEEALAWASLDGPETRGFSDEEVEILTGHPSQLTGSGLAVSEHSALKVSAVFACCRVIAEDVAKMRRFVMRRTFDRERGSAVSREEWHHPLAAIVADYWVDGSGAILPGRPNTWMTGFEFWEYMVFHAALYGMSAAWVIRHPVTGHVVELLPLRPGACQPQIDARGWVVGYRINGYGESVLLMTGDVLVLRGSMSDETSAFEPVRLAREAIGLAAAIERSQTRFHKNDMRPSGLLQIDLGTTSNDAKSREVLERVRADWREKYGPGGEGGLAVLDKKFTFQELQIKGTDAQTIENRRFQIEEICRVFRVNPSKIMHQGAAQKGTVEQDALSHVSDTVGVWAKRCSEACDRDLVDRTNRDDSGIYVDFDDAALVRGTLAERMNGYERMLKAGWSPNEVRQLEGWDPKPFPEMDRPQLLANNTGLAPTPLDGATDSRPAKTQGDPGAGGADSGAGDSRPAPASPEGGPIAALPVGDAAANNPRPPGSRPKLPKPAGKSSAPRSLMKGLRDVLTRSR